jgi:hypothetical protein
VVCYLELFGELGCSSCIFVNVVVTCCICFQHFIRLVDFYGCGFVVVAAAIVVVVAAFVVTVKAVSLGTSISSVFAVVEVLL